MNTSFEKRLEALEQSAGFAPKTHVLWDGGQDIAAAIAEMVASGRAAADDKFVAIGWLPPGDKEMPMDESRWTTPRSEWPSRDPPPSAANDDDERPFWGPLDFP